MVDEEDLILIGGGNSYQVIIDSGAMYSKHIKEAIHQLEGDKIVIFSEWAINKRWKD